MLTKVTTLTSSKVSTTALDVGEQRGEVLAVDVRNAARDASPHHETPAGDLVAIHHGVPPSTAEMGRHEKPVLPAINGRRPKLLNMYDIVHQLTIAATPDRVYEAVTTSEGLASWWTTDVSSVPPTANSWSASTGRLGSDAVPN